MEEKTTNDLPKVRLKRFSGIELCDEAIGQCHNSGPKQTIEEQTKRIQKVGLKMKHESVLEHIVFTFDISNISRALLQEFARHRIASLTVKSSRYTLKELKTEEPFHVSQLQNTTGQERILKYVKLTKNDKVNAKIIETLEGVRELIKEGISNDITKYALPDAYKTSLTWTINARALRNFLQLRTNKAALWEIRDLAYAVYDSILPSEKFLFEDVIYKKDEKAD